jgi:dTMP kinase
VTHHPQRGRFITLEGGEGAGKSTQLRALAAWLRAQGIDVVETREPGGSEGAEAIRELLLTGQAGRWNSRAEALLFAAARADHVEKRILPALEQGQWVLCDRFIDSSRAYQSGASGLDDADIMKLHAIGSKGLLPDRTFVLAVPLEEGARRAEARDNGASDRFSERGTAFHQRVADAFAAYAAQDPRRVRTIDASGDAQSVTARLVADIADMLP